MGTQTATILSISLALVGAILGSTGCDDADGPAPYEVGYLNTAGDYDTPPVTAAAFADLFDAEPYAAAECNGLQTNIDQDRAVRLFHHERFEGLARYSRGLARYFSRLNVRFSTQYASIEVPLEWATDIENDAKYETLYAAFPDVNFASNVPPPESKLPAIAATYFELFMGPIIDLGRAYDADGPNVTQLILLPKIDQAGSPTFTLDGTQILGVAISAEWMRRVGVEYNGLFAHFPLGDDFSPMVFLNAGLMEDMIERGLDPVAADLVVAHEFGHTLGLDHFDRPGNMMKPFQGPEDVRCQERFNEAQVRTMASVLSSGEQVAQSLTAPVPPQAVWDGLRRALDGDLGLPMLRISASGAPSCDR